MRTRRLSAIWLPLVVGLVGCGPKAQLRDDPFLPPAAGSRQSVPATPRERDTFQTANDAARQRDLALGISTSPATDPFLDSQPFQPGGGPAVAASGSSDRRYPEDSYPDERSPSPWAEPASRQESLPATAATPANEPTNEYQTVRQRLDRIGAKNIRSEKEASGEYLFHCELEHPKQPGVLRVFEARHADEEKAMLAVTESAERWVANPQ